MERTIFFVVCLASVARASVLSFGAEKDAGLGAGVSKDVRYDKWLNPQRILYRFDDGSYATHEKALIMTAMSQIAADMSKCISFQEYNADTDTGLDNIYISKTLNDGSIPATCFTFYGRLLRAAGQGQKMAIHDGPNGCMDSLREIMKILVNVLGLRNEYNRPDRDEFIKVFPANLQSELRFSNLLNSYNASQVSVLGKPFDYHSVTIPRANRYAILNESILEFPALHEIPNLDHLSREDCVGLSAMYSGCDAAKCADPYEALAVVANDKKNVADNHKEKEAETTTQALTTVLLTEATTTVAETTTLQPTTQPPTTAELKIAVTEAAVVETTTLAAVPAVVVAAALPANLTEVPLVPTTTTLAPTLNVTLSDVIIPRKAITDVVPTLASNTTEGPMLVVSESVPAIPATIAMVGAVMDAIFPIHTDATTETSATVKMEATTTPSPQMKLILIMANQNSLESSTEAAKTEATSAAASTEVFTSPATSSEVPVVSTETTSAAAVASSELPITTVSEVLTTAGSTEAPATSSLAPVLTTEAVATSSVPPVAAAIGTLADLVPLFVAAANETKPAETIAIESTSTVLPESTATALLIELASSTEAHPVELTTTHNSTEMLAQ